jgi:signal transduction histidine kinase
MCRRILERHGGQIWVDSQIADGCEFTFTLPIDQPAAG